MPLRGEFAVKNGSVDIVKDLAQFRFGHTTTASEKSDVLQHKKIYFQMLHQQILDRVFVDAGKSLVPVVKPPADAFAVNLYLQGTVFYFAALLTNPAVAMNPNGNVQDEVL